MGRAVLLREGDVHGDGGLGLGALELLFEARDEAVGADHDLGAFGRAALEGLAVDAAHEVGDHHVALFGLGLLAAGLLLVGAILLGDGLELLVHLFVGHGVDRTLQLDAGDVHRLELGHHLHRQVVGQVGLAGEHLLDVAVELQVGRGGDAHLGLVQRLLLGVVQRLLHDLAHQRLAVHALDVGGRHLAGAEALDVHLRADFVDPGLELLEQVLDRNRDAIDAAQALAGLLGDLHRHSGLPPSPAGGALLAARVL